MLGTYHILANWKTTLPCKTQLKCILCGLLTVSVGMEPTPVMALAMLYCNGLFSSLVCQTFESKTHIDHHCIHSPKHIPGT